MKNEKDIAAQDAPLFSEQEIGNAMKGIDLLFQMARTSVPDSLERKFLTSPVVLPLFASAANKIELNLQEARYLSDALKRVGQEDEYVFLVPFDQKEYRYYNDPLYDEPAVDDIDWEEFETYNPSQHPVDSIVFEQTREREIQERKARREEAKNTELPGPYDPGVINTYIRVDDAEETNIIVARTSFAKEELKADVTPAEDVIREGSVSFSVHANADYQALDTSLLYEGWDQDDWVFNRWAENRYDQPFLNSEQLDDRGRRLLEALNKQFNIFAKLTDIREE